MPDGKFCPMGNEFIFYSLYANKLHGEPTYWTGAKYDYGLDEMNIGDFDKVDCVTTLSMFSVLSHDKQTNERILSVFWGNNQEQANDKVYNVIRGVFNGVSDIVNHHFMGNMVHVLQMNDGSFRYMMSYFEPRMNFKLLEGIGQRNTSVTVSFSNKGSKPYSFTKNLEIIKFDSNVTVTSLDKSNSKPFGLIDIEEYVRIKGPVFNASLSG